MSVRLSRRKRFAKWRIDLAIHEAIGVARKRSLEPHFQALLAALLARTDLLQAGPVGGRAGWQHVERLLWGLISLCKHHRNWLRDVAEWTPTDAGCLDQFGSLANHLLSIRALPTFLTRIWIEEPSKQATHHQKLFKHLAQGNSIRGADTPIRLTKSMSRFFLDAPAHLSVEQALRWSQVRGLGGDQKVAEAVFASRIGDYFENEPLWRRVIELIIADRRFEVTWIRPFISFLRAHEETLVRRGLHNMKQHQFSALLRQAKAWAKREHQYEKRRNFRWSRLPIGGLRHFETPKHEWSVRYWTIRELVDQQELIDEGVTLDHCVAS